MGRKWVLMATVMLAAAVGTVQAESADDVFKGLFGEQMAKVKGSASKADDVDLAGKLVETARTSSDEGLIVLLCDNAFALARRTSQGYATAVEAMRLLGQRVPAKASYSRDNLMTILPKMYANRRGEDKYVAGRQYVDLLTQSAEARIADGDPDAAAKLLTRASTIAKVVKCDPFDDIQSQLDRLGEQRRVANELKRLEARLARDPNDASAGHDLAMLHVVAFDAPQAAQQYAAHVDDYTHKNIDLATQGIESLTETDCQRLAEWYQALAEEAKGPCKAALLNRAIGYYQRFLDTHKNNDLTRTKAAVVCDRLRKEAAPLHQETIDLLKWVDVDVDEVYPDWRWDGTLLTGESQHYANIILPVTVRGSYELYVQFSRKAGNDAFCVGYPVGDQKAYLEVSSYRNTVTGIGRINGKHTNENETTNRTFRTQNDVLYSLTLRVDLIGNQAKIVAAINGQTVTQWQGPTSAISPLPQRSTADLRIAAPGGLSLGLWKSLFHIHVVKLRVLEGTATPLRAELAKVD